MESREREEEQENTLLPGVPPSVRRHSFLPLRPRLLPGDWTLSATGASHSCWVFVYPSLSLTLTQRFTGGHSSVLSLSLSLLLFKVPVELHISWDRSGNPLT